LRFDVFDVNGTKLNPGNETDFRVSTQHPVWIRVWGPYATGLWTLRIEVNNP